MQRDAEEGNYRKIFQTIKRMVGLVCHANSVMTRTQSRAEPNRVVSPSQFGREPLVPHLV
jgi:hypothetical protein